jgi:MFS family permease
MTSNPADETGASNRPRGLRRTFESLGLPNYRLFFVGQVISITGTWMQRVAQDWLILELGGGAQGLSIGIALQATPYLTIGLWGGVLVDRFDARKLFLLTQVCQASVALLLGFLIINDHVTLAIVYGTALAVGCIGVVESPARQSFVLDIVARDQAANAVSLNSSINNLARLSGPAIAGATIGVAGTGIAYIINAATFLAIIVAMLKVNSATLHQRVRAPTGGGRVVEGLQHAWKVPAIRNTLVATFLVSAFSQNFRIVLPLFASGIFNGGSDSYGVLMSAVAVGALFGALLCAHLARPSLRMLAVQCLVFGGFLVVAAAAPTYVVLLVLMVGAGVGNTSFNTTSNSMVVLTASPSMRGRVVSVRTLVTNGSTLVGSLTMGVLCEQAGARVGMAVGGAVALLAGAITLRGREAGKTPPLLPPTELGRPL